jgi:hypothetical protein
MTPSSCAVQPVQDVHQGRLARAVLAEEAVDLPGFHNEIDVVVATRLPNRL